MANQLSIEDTKPKLGLVEDVKSKFNIVEDTKPKMDTFSRYTNRTYEVTINAGQPIGLLLALTYPNTFTVVQDHD